MDPSLICMYSLALLSCPSHETLCKRCLYPSSLGFSVTIFCAEALVAIMILLIRRNPAVGGELGGPKSVKTVTSSIFVCLWITYVALSAMEAYGVIQPGF